MSSSSGKRLDVAQIQAGLAQAAAELRAAEKHLRRLFRASAKPTNRAMLAGEIPFDLKTELWVALQSLLGDLSPIIEQIEVQSRTTEETAHLPWRERGKRPKGRKGPPQPR